MILVDTSIWIDHLRSGDERLSLLLHDGQVLAHPFVTGEVALGHLTHRSGVLGALQSLAQASIATEAEVLHYIDSASLHGRGIGYIDAHLLVSCLLAPGTTLWTRDKRLLAVAASIGIAASTAH